MEVYKKLGLRKGRRPPHVVNRIHVDARQPDRKKGAWEITKRVLTEARFVLRIAVLVLALLHLREITGHADALASMMR